MKLDKSKMKDEKGRYLVQGLFLEDRYNPDMSMFTFDGEDKVYKGKTFYSLKRLYLDMADPVEYRFATTYLYDWPHWERLCKNALVGRHIEAWRRELQLMLAAEGVQNMLELAANGSSFQAAKYLAENGWVKEKRGRPSKEEIEGHLKAAKKEVEEFNEDFELLKLENKG